MADVVSEPLDLQRLQDFTASLVGMPCWRAYSSFGNSPGLFFGERIRRTAADAIKAHPRWKDKPPNEVPEYTGEASLIIWCAWRLDDDKRVITSWDDQADAAESGLKRVVEASITGATVTAPAGDFQLSFSNGITLRAFCDHVPGSPSFEGNWELRLREDHVFVGPGSVARYSQVSEL